MIRQCSICGSDNYYAKGLCRNCYSKLNRHKFQNADELNKYLVQKKRNKAIKDRRKNQITLERMKIRSTNEYKFRPSSVISQVVIDWYYYTQDRYLIMDFDNLADRKSAYNSIYAMTKRRHSLPVKRYLRGNSIIVERVA